MPSYHFNTLDMAKRLQIAGFSEKQAREIISVITDTQMIQPIDAKPELTSASIIVQLDFLKKGLVLVAGGLIFLFGLVILLADRL